MRYVQRWARAKGDATGGLRRGAWYLVVKLTSRDAVVAVESQQVRLPRGALQFASVRPHTWTLVTCPTDARDTPVLPGELYAVCPSCQTRTPLGGSPQGLPCPRCNGGFKGGCGGWVIRERREPAQGGA